MTFRAERAVMDQCQTLEMMHAEALRTQAIYRQRVGPADQRGPPGRRPGPGPSTPPASPGAGEDTKLRLTTIPHY